MLLLVCSIYTCSCHIHTICGGVDDQIPGDPRSKLEAINLNYCDLCFSINFQFIVAQWGKAKYGTWELMDHITVHP
jgi:hypothetical protein